MTPLEQRQLLAPFVSQFPTTATFTAFANNPKGVNAGSVTVTYGGALASQTGATNALPAFPEAAAITSVSELTPSTSFGGDIVRIRTGPGGDFGKNVYAISRGAGDNVSRGAINRPGVIYRVDTATGKSTVFFDLNTVIPQLDPTQTNASTSLGTGTGLTNFYDIAFDSEGVFDGRQSMFVSSSDRSNPAKNAIYRVAPDGTFLGAFTTLADNSLSSAKLTFNPTAILIPPVEQQSFLRGLFAGSGLGSGSTTNFSSTATFGALFFDSNQFRPGQPLSNAANLPTGVKQTNLFLGPQVGLTAANQSYSSLVYDVFTDFGTPGLNVPNSPFQASPGISGVQGLNGELLINLGFNPNANANTFNNPTPNIDLYPVGVSSQFRRFQDIAFDQFGYFSQGLPITTANAAGGGGAGGGTGTGTGGSGSTGGTTGGVTSIGTFAAPVYAGSLFVADLATGLAVSVPVPAPATGTAPTPGPNPILIPVQGPGGARVDFPDPATGITSRAPTGSLGGRIVRIDQFGRLSNFAQGFNTNNSLESDAFSGSSLSITFSSDGTTLYAADDDGIWQFKTTASLAGSSSGSLIGLNDLRTLGVPYDGQNTAVDVVDTGVDALNPNFRGRVANGTSTTISGGFGNDDFAAGFPNVGSGSTGGNTGGNAGGNAGGNGGGNTGVGSSITLNANGHGTPVAGIIAQFVPQATLNPINVFEPFIASLAVGTGGNNGGGATFSSNQATTTDAVFAGFKYVTDHPYVADPVRPGNNDRVIAASLAFGTTQTFETEAAAYKQYPQVVASFKNQLDKFLKVGIAPIAASGQFGATIGANGGGNTNNGGGGGGIGGGGGNTNGGGVFDPTIGAQNNAQNPSVGDVNGMSLPAIFNEVISVTGTYPFIHEAAANTPPNDPANQLIGRSRGPVLLFGNTYNSPGSLGDSQGNGIGNTLPGGGATGTGTGGNTGGNTGGTGTGGGANNLGQLTGAEGGGGGTNNGGGGGGNAGGGGNGGNTAGGGILTFSDRLLGSVNRNATTDFAAPALDAPTFRRTFAGNGFDNNVFEQGGTSVSSAIVTGSYALVSSALEYWNQIRLRGTTSSAYLTTPVDAHTLNYGAKNLYNLTAFNNPNGINAILAYTAVPAKDINDDLTVAGPPKILGSTLPRSFARVDVGNAIAAVEGKVALDYLLKHNTFNIIDTNHNGLITSQEIQNFVDRSKAMGLQEAGAMARLLGGTARSAIDSQFTLLGEQPDQPDVLQRRFNFFDYSVHGHLQGSVSIAQFKLLSKYILPIPDAYVITNRPRASANGFLVAPAAQRNFKDLQRLSSSYEFVPKSKYKPFNGTSPAQFGVNSNQKGASSVGPVFTLFDGKAGGRSGTATGASTASSSTATTSGSTTPNSGGMKLAATTTMTTGTGAGGALGDAGSGTSNQNLVTKPNTTGDPAAVAPAATSTDATAAATQARADKVLALLTPKPASTDATPAQATPVATQVTPLTPKPPAAKVSAKPAKK